MNAGLTTIALAAILGGLILLIVSMAVSDEGNKLLTQYEPAAQIISSIVLVGTVVVLYIQLGHIREQNELQRNVASKSAIQALNEVILDEKQEDFLRFLFPDLIEPDLIEPDLIEPDLVEPGLVEPDLVDASNDKSKLTPGEKQAREIMMAFSLMNSLEMLYLARKDTVERKDFKNLLRGFTGSVRKIWEKDKNFATVYHPDFKKIVEEVFNAP